jgi:hypothetical protein
VTSDPVLVESWLLMRARGGGEVAGRFWAAIHSGLAAVETVLPGGLDAAWRIGEVFADEDFSIVDRTSFAVMERLGITRRLRDLPLRPAARPGVGRAALIAPTVVRAPTERLRSSLLGGARVARTE